MHVAADSVCFLSVLAHDVAGLLAKNRRKRQQLGAALEKVTRGPGLRFVPRHYSDITLRRTSSERLPRFNATGTRARVGTSGCRCERPRRICNLFRLFIVVVFRNVGGGGVIGCSLGLRQVHHHVQRAADGDTPQHDGG